jgi:HlyD family secretion protein
MVQLNKSSLAICGAVSLILIAGFLLFGTLRPKTPDWITAKVERGDVAQIVSVSGFVEAKNTAELAFPTTGIVTEVFVDEGATVKQGQVLATLGSSQQVAQRNEALAALQGAEARLEKLLKGADATDKDLAQVKLQNAELALARTQAQEQQKVDNAMAVLLSDNLEALSVDPKESAEAPTVTGTYTCEEKGTYTLNVYGSNAYTRYSYRMSGLEEGVSAIATQQPAPLGSCGLFIQFDPEGLYEGSTWIIEIPNTRSGTYVANESSYKLAVKQQADAVAEAEEALDIARLEAAGVTGDARSEDVREAQASRAQAEAQIANIDALLSDRSIVAPFDGAITDVSILKGEAASLDPVITLLSSDAFELKVRIPEIDITKLEVGQLVTAVFDAKPSEVQSGSIAYISPLAVIIDGVAYFEATIGLETKPSWLRSGLNADVDIVVARKENVLRVPRRFVIENPDGTYSVRVPRGSQTATTTINPEFSGNDGFIEVTGLKEGDTVVAP